MRLSYKQLSRKHPEYVATREVWDDIDALYSGGHKLLRNDVVLSRLLPRWQGETIASWRARKKFAHYEPHLAAVIDHIVAQLKSDPIVVADEMATAGAPLDPLYAEFFEDCTPEGAECLTFADFLAEQVRLALQFRCVWTLVDLPVPTKSYTTELEQREAGALEPFAVSVDPRSVYDWRCTKAGAVTWAVVYDEVCERLSPEDDRDMVTEAFTVYTDRQWLRFEFKHKHGENVKDENEVVAPVDGGPHSFGRCPLIRFDLTDRFWLGDRAESLAREHFNRLNGSSEFGRKLSYPQLYEFVAPSLPGIDQPISEIQEDAGRATNQARGPGYVQVRGADDRAAYVSPDAAAYKQISDEVDKCREAIYRVTYQMALSQDNKGALIRRSAESKGIDNAATTVILVAIGTLIRSHASEVLKAISAGIGDPQKHDFEVAGAAKFDAASSDQFIDRAAVVKGITVRSAKFNSLLDAEIARCTLDAGIAPDDMATIKKELDAAYTAEDFTMQPAMPGPSGGSVNANGGDSGEAL